MGAQNEIVCLSSLSLIDSGIRTRPCSVFTIPCSVFTILNLKIFWKFKKKSSVSEISENIIHIVGTNSMCPVFHLFSVVFFLQTVCFELLGPVSLFVITNRTTIFTLENPRAFGSAGIRNLCK